MKMCEGTPDDFVIGCEESHGILVTPQIRDKDAAGAALLLAELALDQKRQGQTVLDYLDRLAREFGYFRNEGVPVFLRGIQGKTQMQRMLDRLREKPPQRDAGLAGHRRRGLAQRGGPVRTAQGGDGRRFPQRADLSPGRAGQGGAAAQRHRTQGQDVHRGVFGAESPDVPDDVWQATCRDVDGQMRNITEAFVRHALGLIGLDPSAAGVR